MTKRKEKKVAIVISTKNRSKYVIGLLRYYARIKSHHTVYIGDASDPYHIEKLIPVIKSLKNNINVIHKQYPEYCRGAIDTAITVKKLLGIIEEEFVAISGDDDFFIPRSMDNCVDFLETNPNYSSAQGSGRFIHYDEDRGTSIISGSYNINEYQGTSGAERIKMLMNNYSMLCYSVQRKEILLKTYKNMELLTNQVFVELMPVGLSVILGKSKKLNELYIIRGIHDERDVQRPLIEKILDPQWHKSFQIYINTLSEEIRKVDGIEDIDAKEIVKQSFIDYMERSLRKIYYNNEVIPLKMISKFMLNRVKQGLPIYVKKFIKNKILLDGYYDTSGLSKTSPYYDELTSLLSGWNRIYKN